MDIISKIKNKCIKLSKNKCLTALFINTMYLIGMLIFFEPLFSIDDIAISNYLYGAYQGEYTHHTLYSSFIYGRIVCFFLNFFPELPWYTILTYIWVFIALTLITYIILCWDDSSLGKMILHIVLLFFSYEGYICIQFTKVAAIVGVAGLFSFFPKKQRKIVRFIGICLVFLSIIIRKESALMAISGWMIMMFLNFIIKFLKERCWSNKELLRIIIGTTVIVALYILPSIVPKYDSDMEEYTWESFYDWSDARVVIQDYDIPDYEENKVIYESINVSSNDLYVWRSWNFDLDGITVEIGDTIGKLQSKDDSIIKKAFTISNLLDYGKVGVKKLVKNDCFYAFLLLIMLLVIGMKKSRLLLSIYILCASGIGLLLDYYLYINGRYNIHRVDVGITLLAIMILIYLVLDNLMITSFTLKKFICPSIVILLVVPFQVHVDDLPAINIEYNTINKVFYKNVHEDLNHYYVLGNSRSNAGNLRYLPSAFECITPGLYKNVFGITAPSPIIQENLQEYNIDNPYTDLIDNEMMYLVLDENNRMKEPLETYIEQHANTEVQLILVKNFCEKHMYRVVSTNLNELINLENEQIEDIKLSSDIVTKIVDKELNLSGNVYIEGVDAFSQNVYVQIVDKKTQKSNLYYTLQSCDESYEKNEKMYFSRVSTTINLPKYYDKSDSIYLIIESDEQYYRVQICE